MSRQLLSRSADLRRLVEDGYEVQISGGHLVVGHVPYVNSQKEVRFGKLVSTLNLAGDVTTKPDTHVAHFAGDFPCHKDGREIAQIRHNSGRNELARGLAVDHSFSNKPAGGYANYYEKMTTYINIISGPARALDESVTAQTFVVENEDDKSPFCYMDTASTRAQITRVSEKLALAKVAIIGLGGTGSYVLDLVAKTPVREIHLFDGDEFSQHNAFRSPGAASLGELRQRPQKVAYLKERYSKLHRGIVAHDGYMDEAGVEGLRGTDFVFLCLDKGKVKRFLIDELTKLGISFIDVGMGVELVDDGLIGVLRVTTVTPKKNDHAQARIPCGEADDNNEYSKNIQIADLNALNAALAVIKWKKLLGFYKDLEGEHHSTYTVDGNVTTNEESS